MKMKKWIKVLLTINLVLGVFQINETAFAKEVENVQQSEENIKLQNLMKRIQNKKLGMLYKIRQLKSRPHTLIKLELVGVSDEGQYWYDHNAEFEPRIYVDWKTAEDYAVEDYELGDYATGIFDITGWDLYGFDKTITAIH